MVCYGFRANQHSTRSGWPPFALGSDADRSEMHHFGQGMSHKPSVRQHPRRNGTAKVAPPWRWEWLHELFLLPRQLIWSPWGDSSILSDILSGILSDISSDILSDIPCDILHSQLGPCSAHSQLRSASARWALALAVEVRQCPLTSGAPGWGPAVPLSFGARGCAELWSSSAHWDLTLAVEAEAEAEMGGPALIKPRDPHLAGGYYQKLGDYT